MLTSDMIFLLLNSAVQAAGAFFKKNPTEIEQALLRSAQAGVKAYEAHKGQPIDPSLLHQIEPVA